MTPLPKRKPRNLGKDGRELESPIRNAIKAALTRMPGVLCFRNNTGVLEDRNGVKVRFGLALGSSDLICIVRSNLFALNDGGDGFRSADVGRFVAIEVKRPGEKPSRDQEKFIDLVRSFGGAACYVDNVPDAVAFVQQVQGAFF